MPQAKSHTEIQAKITLEITEKEAMVLNAIGGYGAKAFLEMFYKNMGEAYLKPYEKEAIDLLNFFKNELPKHYYDAKSSRQIIHNKKVKEESDKRAKKEAEVIPDRRIEGGGC